MYFVEVKSLAGVNYIRAADVIAVQFSDPNRCSVMMAGGISLACTEPAAVIAARVEVAIGERPAEAPAVEAQAAIEADPAGQSNEKD